MNITAELFKFYVGHEHEDDDLERCNCPRAGQVGHSMCGWNHKENLPVYMAGRGGRNKEARSHAQSGAQYSGAGGIEMKTSKLSGAALDWAVAKCEGVTCAIWQGVVVDEFSNPLMYHDDWALAGAIIEREKIGLHYGDGTWGVNAGRWEANHPNCLYVEGGETPLIAAMRCYVASCLGDEVQLPEELK